MHPALFRKRLRFVIIHTEVPHNQNTKKLIKHCGKTLAGFVGWSADPLLKRNFKEYLALIMFDSHSLRVYLIAERRNIHSL
jgi:hypothetical protein